MIIRPIMAAIAVTLVAACSARLEAAPKDDGVPGADTPGTSDGGVLPETGAATPEAPDATSDGGTPLPPACARPPVVRETFTSFADQGTTTFVRLAENPRGIIVALHGTGGSSSSLVTESVEWASFFGEAAARDYVIVVPESLQRTSPRQWEAQTADGDTPHIAALLDRVKEKAKLPGTLPVYIVGMSQGGGSAPIVGALLAKDGRPVRAIGVYCAGATTVFERPDYTLPTVFSLVENDTVMTERAEVEGYATSLAKRGVATDLAVLKSAPLCPEAFTRIPGIDAAASRDITSQLISAKVLDADGNVVGYSRDEEIAPLIPNYASFGRQVEEQVRVARAEHTFFGARNAATLDFFDSHR